MPKKIRELKEMLRQSGFTQRPGKGSHTNWTHPDYMLVKMVWMLNVISNLKMFATDTKISAKKPGFSYYFKD